MPLGNFTSQKSKPVTARRSAATALLHKRSHRSAAKAQPPPSPASFARPTPSRGSAPAASTIPPVLSKCQLSPTGSSHWIRPPAPRPALARSVQERNQSSEGLGTLTTSYGQSSAAVPLQRGNWGKHSAASARYHLACNLPTCARVNVLPSEAGVNLVYLRPHPISPVFPAIHPNRSTRPSSGVFRSIAPLGHISWQQ